MRKKNLIFNIFSNFAGIISDFLRKKSTSLSKMNFAYLEQLQQKSGRTGKALYVSSGTIGAKSFGTSQNFLTFRQWARKCPRNVFSRCGKNALNPRIEKNTLRKMKFSIQKSNAEYIIFFWAKTFWTGSAMFHPDYQNRNPRVQKTILKKSFSPEDDVLLVTKVFRKNWPAQKNSQVCHEGFLRVQWNIYWNKFLVEIKMLDFSNSECKIIGLQNGATVMMELAKLHSMYPEKHFG